MTSDVPVASELSDLQYRLVEDWHQQEAELETIPQDNDFGFFLTANHLCNFKLWHEEDFARRQDVADADIARCKRAIDAWNQQRNDYIEKMDEAYIHFFQQHYAKNNTARQHSETIGAICDKLSIINLKVYHMRELVDAYPEKTQYRDKVSVLLQQRQDLSQALAQLFSDIAAGKRFIKVYRQLKMYNDPEMNAQVNSKLRENKK
jgi:hypothetical protein